MNSDLGTKWLGLLHDLLPDATRFAVLVNPENPTTAEPMIKNVQAAASTIGRQIEVLNASSNRDIDTAFANLVQKRAAALLISTDALFLEGRVQLSRRRRTQDESGRRGRSRLLSE